MKIVFRYLLFWVIHKYPSKQYIILCVDIGYTCNTMCLCIIVLSVEILQWESGFSYN